jgi:protein tyrosine phosphatase (PTP) superfamily phosphohydrolase (DUF442 family)
MQASILKLSGLFLCAALGGCATAPPHSAQTPTSQMQAKPMPSALADRVTRGKVQILAQPNAQDFAALKAEGVRQVINLRTDAEMAELAAAGFAQNTLLDALGLSHTRAPIGGDAGFGSAAVDALHAAIQRGEPIALHCASGGRSAMVYAAYRVKYEQADPEQALAEIPEKKLWPLSLQQLSGIALGLHRKPATPEAAVLEQYLAAFAKEDLQAMAALMHPKLRYYQRDEQGSLTLQAQGIAAMRESMASYFKSIEVVSAQASTISQTGSILSFQETVGWRVKDGNVRSNRSQAAYEIRDGLVTAAWYF